MRNSDGNPSSSKAITSTRSMQDERRRSKMTHEQYDISGAFAGRFFPQIPPPEMHNLEQERPLSPNFFIIRPLLGTHDKHITLPHNKHMTKELPTSSSRHSNVNRSSSKAIFSDKTDNTTRGGEAE
jgi:hypothetical protein